MEHRDGQPLLQLLFNFKAAGGGDVLQVNAPEAQADELDGADDFIRVFGIDAEGNGVHVGKFLKQGALPFHHRHGCFRADVPQSQHRRAVGNDRHQVAPAGKVVHLAVVLGNLHAGRCHAGGVGNGELLFGFDGGAGNHLNLSLQFPVFFNG